MATDFPFLFFEDNNFLLLDKPHSMPTVPLKTQALQGTLLEQAALLCPQILEVKGKNSWEGGALHRLDTATAGLVLFAKNQLFYERMQKLQEDNLFEKYYIAQTFENNSLKGYDIEEKTGIITISSYFRPFGPKAKQVRATLDEKKASPKILYKTAVIREENTFYCTITKGFRHQIRAHLAWAGHPIIGDSLYGQSVQTSGVKGDDVQTSGAQADSVHSDSVQTNRLQGQSQNPQTLQLECVGISFPQVKNGEEKQYFFKKKETFTPNFPSLCRYANTLGNVIIQL